MIDSSPAAQLLQVEAGALEAVLRRAPEAAYARPTVCDGWSVRDVLAHCAAALGRVASGDLHGFTPAENQADVDARRDWPLDRLLDELFAGYTGCTAAVAAAGGRLDGVALGEWVHGGDVREALDEPDAYTSAGVELALELFEQRGASRLPAVVAELPDRVLHLGPVGAGSPGRLVTDVETLVRLLSGRRPDPTRYHLDGPDPAALNLFG